MNALQFFADHWLICLIALWFMVELVGRCYSRTMRTILVSLRGWPPNHLDADGDWKPKEQTK